MSLRTFTDAYIECALWSSEPDPGGEEWQAWSDSNGLSEMTEAKMARDCADFYENWMPVWDAVGHGDDQAGHDFWLTRNGHGAGFWDRGLGEVGERLSEACKPYGSYHLYVGDDGKIYGE